MLIIIIIITKCNHADGTTHYELKQRQKSKNNMSLLKVSVKPATVTDVTIAWSVRLYVCHTHAFGESCFTE